MYAAHFRLTELPFRPLPDSRFLVDSAQHRAALALLLALVGQGGAFLVVCGAFGTGKTLLAQRLIESLDPSRVHAARMLGGGRNGDELLRGAAMAFGIAVDDDEAPAPALRAAVEAHGRMGRSMLLVLDEAHNLAADALEPLRALAKIRVDGRAVLQACLVGKHAPAGLDAATPVVELAPLAREETHAYVVQRLLHAGWDAHPGLDLDALDEIHRHSGGVPREINRLAHRTLLDLYRSGGTRVTVGAVAAAAEALRLTAGAVAPDAVATTAASAAADEPPPTVGMPGPDERAVDLDAMMAAITGARPAPREVPEATAAPQPAEGPVPWLMALHAEPDDAPAAPSTAHARWRRVALASSAVAVAAVALVWLFAGDYANPRGADAPRATASDCDSTARSLGLCSPDAAAPAPADCDRARSALGLCTDK